VTWRHGTEHVRDVPLREPAAGPSMQLSVAKTNRIVLPRSEAGQLLGDASELLRQALFKPYMEQGRPEGFTVTNIVSNSVLRRLGIENGDVLLRINGERLTGPERLLAAYNALGRGSAATLDIKRGSNVLSLLIEIEQAP
jgi:general secretion pathway protein C